MRGPGDILLVSTYELGHSPNGVAVPAAHLERAGFRPAALDLSVEPLDEERIRRARLVAISVPMHTALRLGLAAAARIRAERPDAVLCFHGLYAPLHADLLVGAGARAVLGAECEEQLVALAGAVERGEDALAPSFRPSTGTRGSIRETARAASRGTSRRRAAASTAAATARSCRSTRDASSRSRRRSCSPTSPRRSRRARST